jgi:hypothetical protein
MTTPVLGSHTFLETPTVNGQSVLLTAGGLAAVSSGTTAARPAAGNVGDLYVATDTKVLYSDNGTTWDAIGGASGSTSPILRVWSTNITPQSGSTLIPYDATVPLSTEGTQIWTQTVTPTSATSKFIINVTLWVATGTGTRYPAISLFKGTTCIGVSSTLCSVANAPFQHVLCEVDTGGATTPITYSVRFGVSSNTTWYIGQTTTGTYGGVGSSNITMFETL